MVAGCGARRVGGSRRGLVLAVGRGGLVGGRKSRGKRSRPAGSGLQSEQCYRLWRKVRRGGGLVGPAWAWAVVGCGVRGGVGWGRGVGYACGKGRGVGRGVSGVQGVGARLSAVQSWALGVGGVWWWWVCRATGVLLRGSDEGEDCLGTEAGEPGAGEWGAGGGLSPAGMAGVPWGPVGAEAPHVGWVRNHGLYFRHRSS